MIDQAVAELPNECCGLLAGCRLPEQAVARVSRRYALANAAASPREFLSEPKGMFAAVRDMRQHGLDVLAVYHSHPCSEPLPSRTDRERNYSPEVVNVIISLTDKKPAVRAWWLNGDSFLEAEWECVENDG
jgi:proteasome lid subunit RPN8/RPN11